MVIFIYSDESGVFDCVHNDYFVFAGLMCFGKDEKDIISRKYAHVESIIRKNAGWKNENFEIKGCRISNKQKGKIYRSLNNTYKFCVVIKEYNVNEHVFENKKHRQRYLDYAYKMVLKKCFQNLISSNIINPSEITDIYVNMDDHITCTDGLYELKENLLKEFKIGMFNYEWEKFFPPIFPKLADVHLSFCDSKSTRLIRAADIIANHIFHEAVNHHGIIANERNIFIFYLPSNVIDATGNEYFESKNESLLVIPQNEMQQAQT